MVTTLAVSDVIEIVRAVQSYGATVRFLGEGKYTLVGSVPNDVLAAVKARRDDFIRAWEEDRMHRYLRCPPNTLLLRPNPPSWRAAERKRVNAWVMRQGGEVARWALLRASAYKEAKPDWSAAAASDAALADVLHWQFAERHPKPEDVLAGCEEAML